MCAKVLPGVQLSILAPMKEWRVKWAKKMMNVHERRNESLSKFTKMSKKLRLFQTSANFDSMVSFKCPTCHLG